MPVIQKMASVQVLPLNNYANGTRTFGPVDVADDVESIDFSIARCTTATPTIWPNVTTIVQIIPEMSVDGEQTWVPCGAFTAEGGIVLGKTGQEVPFSFGGGNLPDPVNGITRRFRGTSIISGGPCRTSMTVEVT